MNATRRAAGAALVLALPALAAATGRVRLTAATEPLGREEAQRAAREELSRSIYHRDDPSAVDRALQAVARWLARLYDNASAATPGGGIGLVLLLLAVGGLVGFTLWRLGPVRRAAAARSPVATDSTLTAAEYRRLAAEHADAGRHAEAVRDLIRAIVRELEQRGALQPQPGRTADEVAADGARVVPPAGAPLRQAARIFDEIWYGGRTATAEQVTSMRAADEAVRQALRSSQHTAAVAAPRVRVTP